MSDDSVPLVVVGIDGSRHSAVALRQALHEAGRRGGRVLAVAVWERPELTLREFHGVPVHDASGRGTHEQQTREFVDRVRAAAPETAQVPVDVQARSGRPADAEVLVDAARDADLLVVGHRGLGAVRSAALGSVGLGCVLHSRCPVLVVPMANTAASTDAAPAASR